MLAKTFNIGTLDATGLLNRVVCDMATNIHVVKLNCAEDRRIRWTTYQNLDLWSDRLEVFLVDYGFATINTNGELLFDLKVAGMKKKGKLSAWVAIVSRGKAPLLFDVSQYSVRYEYLLWARPAKARR